MLRLKVAKLNITQIKRLHLAIPSIIIIILNLKSEKFFRQFPISNFNADSFPERLVLNLKAQKVRN